ncbi:MAG TPA: choice-of-anchor D domain-containing protein, partial [Candidatus Kapabacteria bacterium]
MKNRITSFKVLFFGVVAALMLFSGVSQAQLRVNQLTTTTFNSTYSTIVGNGGTSLNMSAYNISGYTTMSMPFTFVYDNSTYSSGTTLIVNQCGSVNYGSTIYATYVNRIIPSNTSYSNTISPLTGLQYVTQVYYMVSGSAPNRVFTIEWDQCRAYPVSSGASINYQLKIYETSNMIEFLYSGYNFNLAYSISYPHSAGLNGSVSPSYAQNVVYGATATNNSPSSNYRFSGLPNNQLALSPEAMDFGAQFTGVATFGIATARHVGNESTVNLISTSITGPNAADFKVISGPSPSSNLAIGASSTYTIQFIPTFGGPRSATLTITSDGRDSGTQIISLTGTGIAPKINVVQKELFKSKRVRLGDTTEQSIVIQSTGQASLYFTNYPNSFTFTGDNPGDYRVSRVPSNPLPAGASDTLKIKFIPTVEGARPATVNVLSNAENSQSWPVLLKGIGIIPRITVDQSIVDADSVAMGQTSCKDITVSNPGSDTLRILKHYFASK